METKSPEKEEAVYAKLSFLDRYLFVWILAVMVSAVLVGYYVKSVRDAFQVATIASVSLPIAVGLWVMMYPVLCKVRYELLGKMLAGGALVKSLALSFLLNWLLCPALMTGLAWATLPDLPGYRRGVILVGIARCIAMVLVWNDLAKGDPELCAILVAFNSLLQIILYGPLSLFFLEVLSRDTGIHVGMWEVAKSVLLFLGAPLAAGMITRAVLCSSLGKRWYETKFLPIIGPFALLGLLYTIFVMFSLQAHHIVGNLDKVARVAVPLAIYFGIVFAATVGLCLLMKVSYEQSVTQAFTASSNNFELAIAVAVGVFGIDSSEALAATMGPLLEVPILLALVYVMLWGKSKFSWQRT
ncbi:arsenite efflux protein-like protein [Selaginella moellendorffii]|uniref:Arsenite efflux protein-like protein n=1 Tax=Selaginella moellendorffii TaxID=88036 RepID=D8RI16_SELML|nr:arsenite efflux protein-like protein [Selaginella moellendorffii]